MLHRNALFSDVTVRPMRPDLDSQPVQQFLKSMEHSAIITDAFISSETDFMQYKYIIEMEQQIIGVASIELSR